MKVTIDGTIIEGTPEEIKKMMALLGAEIPVKNAEGESEPKTVKRKAEVGERILITNKVEDELRYDNGHTFEVEQVESDGDVWFKKIDGKRVLVLQSEYEVIVDKVTEEFPQSTKLEIGDYVVPTDEASEVYGFTCKPDMKLGKIVGGEIYDDEDDDIRVEIIEHTRAGQKGVSYSVESRYFRKATAEEIAKHTAPETAQAFEVGDRVKALTDGEFGDIEAGEIGEVVETDDGISADDPYSTYVQTDDDDDYFRPQDLEKVTEEETPKFNVGDIVVITANTAHSANEVGDNGKIETIIDDSARVEVPGGKEYGIVSKVTDIRHATDEEKAKYEQAVKVSEIGIGEARKPGEFKKGDIVRVTGGAVYASGTIGIITEMCLGGSFRVKANGKTSGNWHSKSNVELVAPVESRVNNV